MEINEIVKNERKINDFILTSFRPIGAKDVNPIFPYKINYIGKNSSVTFCKMPVIEFWALKSDTAFSFFLLLKSELNVVSRISENYGLPQSESAVELEINQETSSSNSHFWKEEELNLFLGVSRRFKEYGNCYIVVIGDMDYQDVLSLPPLKAF